MSQYSTGTATVTNGSATVTGSGTLWLANVTAGNSFTVAGDRVMYDVASVDSDTQITLSAPYAGTTASGVVYAIGTGFTVPDSFPEMSQGDIETATIFTRGMRKIQSKFIGIAIDKTKLDTVEDGATADQTKADIDALNIDADTLDGIDSLGFDAAGAADTAVSDHVALPDPHTQYAELSGGANANFTAMPQVGGDPIVESGSNADGEWTRWADGTMICTTDSIAGTTTSGGPGFWDTTWTLPIAFISIAYKVFPVHNNQAGVPETLRGGGWEIPPGLTSTIALMRYFPPASGSGTVANLSLDATAIGRWK